VKSNMKSQNNRTTLFRKGESEKTNPEKDQKFQRKENKYEKPNLEQTKNTYESKQSVVCRFCHRAGHKQSTCRYKKRKEAAKLKQVAQQKEKSDGNFKSFIQAQLKDLIEDIKMISAYKVQNKASCELKEVYKPYMKKQFVKLHSKMQNLIEEGVQQMGKLFDSKMHLFEQNEAYTEKKKHRPTYFDEMEQMVKHHNKNLQAKMQSMFTEGNSTIIKTVTDLFYSTKSEKKPEKLMKASANSMEALNPTKRTISIKDILQVQVPQQKNDKIRDEHLSRIKLMCKEQNAEDNQVRPSKFASDDEDIYDWEHRDIHDHDEYNQVEYEQELQYAKCWYVNKKETDFQRKHVKVLEKHLDDDKFILTKFWKNEEKEKQPVAKKCLKKNYRKLNATERDQIQVRDKRENIWNVKKLVL